ncbi:MAG: hypothetical protein KDI71_07105 [Xanthomonadales bacterium]|nr:hypothetical protein [Xanthomonadales bacterium]
MSLRNRLAEFGFEANEDYEFPLRCLMESEPRGLRCLHIAGDSGRRKTAFAQALGMAWEFTHVVYQDCSRRPPPAAPVYVVDPDSGESEEGAAAMTPFERAVTEAAAYSEADRTLLIIDQLQALDFEDQIRLYRFSQEREWTAGDGTVFAHPRNLILALISEDDLYHPLQKASFRVWTDAGSGLVNYQPADFGLASDARWFMDAMAQVFAALQSSPTFSEYSMLVNDIRDRVRTVEHLRVALYGRIEHLDRDLLTARELEPVLGEAVTQINLWVGLDEIELSSPDES